MCDKYIPNKQNIESVLVFSFIIIKCLISTSIKWSLDGLIQADGDVYESDFVDGIREGNGTYRYLNGNVNSGKWWADRKHGAH